MVLAFDNPRKLICHENKITKQRWTKLKPFKRKSVFWYNASLSEDADNGVWSWGQTSGEMLVDEWEVKGFEPAYEANGITNAGWLIGWKKSYDKKEGNELVLHFRENHSYKTDMWLRILNSNELHGGNFSTFRMTMGKRHHDKDRLLYKHQIKVNESYSHKNVFVSFFPHPDGNNDRLLLNLVRLQYTANVIGVGPPPMSVLDVILNYI